MTPRIAVVQHGDCPRAVETVRNGDETYFGMADSLAVLARLVAGRPHLVVSLDAPAGRAAAGLGEYVGEPMPGLPRGVPGTVKAWLWSERVVRRLRAFAPTHVLLRTGGLLGCRVLSACRDRQCGVLVVLAGAWHPARKPVDRWTVARTVRLWNEPFVARVANHRPPALRSLVAAGLDPAKGVAYEWAGERRPADYPPKSLRPGEPIRVAYAGMVTPAKGVGDLVDAVAALRAGGLDVRLTVAGDGDLLDPLRRRAGGLPVEFPGRVSNAEVFRRFLAATVVCVPSRHEFPEGMPHALTEGLASRTPVVASDHPVLVSAFRPDEGLRFFRAGDPSALASALRAVVTDPALYATLSRSTSAAYARVSCPTTFGDVVDAWASTFP